MKYKLNGNWVDLSIKALDSMPLGSIILFAGTDIPTGWMLCDGTSLSEEEYPELFDKIGYTYGGSGTSFSLPNFKGRVGVGKDTTQSYCDNLGETGGEVRHTIQWNELASNTIDTTNSGSNADGYIMRGGYTATGTYNIGGQGAGTSLLQPYIVVNYIIKVSNTTPTMASVVNATNNSTTDTYSCDYENKHFGGVELYNDTTGTTGNVSLNETTANFKYIEIYAVDNDSRTSYFNTFKFNASSTTFNLSGSSVNANNFAIFTSLYTNNGTTLTNGGHYLYNGSISSYPIIRVVKVIGYK